MRDLIIYLIGINVVTFFIYGIDKWKARRGKWRIPEDTLIWLAIAEKTKADAMKLFDEELKK